MFTRALKKNEIGEFTAYDPFGLLKEAQLSGCFVIGAFLKDADEQPSGVMLISLTGKRLVIRWLYVDEELRGRGLGEALLAGAYRIALSRGIKKVRAEIPAFTGRDEICEGEEWYLKDRYFDDEEKLLPQWIFKYQDISAGEKYKDALAGDTKGDVIPLSKLSGPKRQNLITEIAKNQFGVLKPAVLSDYVSIDLDMSIAVQNKGENVGAAIFERAGDDAYLAGFMAVSKSHVTVVLSHAIERCHEVCPDVTIHIDLEKNFYVNIMAEILGEPVTGKMLIADPVSFAKDQADRDEYVVTPEGLDYSK